jgi:hypothetical protein
MIYDTTYALAQILETFLRDHPEVRDTCYRAVLSGQAVSALDASSLLISRFEKWLERDGSLTDSASRTALQEIIEAHVELATTYETAEPLTHA